MKIVAKKSLGQNFLIDKKVLKIISEIVDIKNKDILEVGPGTGNLTSELIKKNPKKIILIEKDNVLLKLLKEKFFDRATYFNEDILKFTEKNLSKEKLTVFGNLPYNISTEILIKWVLSMNTEVWFDKLILMFQKEVANRILSKYNCSEYGRLSIIANWKLDVKKVIDIEPNAFYPQPKVYSSLLIFEPKKKFFKLKSGNSLELVTRTFFNQRRKKIKKPFNRLFNNNTEIAKKYNINLDLRPQNLSFNEYYLLAQEFEKLRN